MYRKLTTAAAVAALAFGLAACGGGGGGNGDTGMQMTPDPMPPAPTPVAVTLPSDGDNYLTDDEKALTDGTASLTTGGTTDVGPYTLTCDAGPCEVTIADGEVTATGTVTAAYSTAAMTAIDAAKMIAMDENSGRALGLSSALTDHGGATGRGERIRGTTKADDLNFARGLSGGAMVSHDTVGWATSDAGMSISGWAGKVVSKGTQSYTVYTDIAAATRKGYLSVYEPGSTPSFGGTAIGTAISPTSATGRAFQLI